MSSSEIIPGSIVSMISVEPGAYVALYIIPSAKEYWYSRVVGFATYIDENESHAVAALVVKGDESSGYALAGVNVSYDDEDVPTTDGDSRWFHSLVNKDQREDRYPTFRRLGYKYAGGGFDPEDVPGHRKHP
jgi:hypothetical protein